MSAASGARARTRNAGVGREDQLTHFRVDSGKLDPAVERVLATTRKAYPTLDIPFHSRWRHFGAGGIDRWAAVPPLERRGARAEFDLAIVSVLLDAGAGPQWRYCEPRPGAEIGRSEGLALASLRMFVAGAFSSRPGDPLRADAVALQADR